MTSNSQEKSFKTGDRVVHKSLGASTVIGIHHVPYGTDSLEGYELINISPDSLDRSTHSTIQLVFADTCTAL